jgi:hypothetical protein
VRLQRGLVEYVDYLVPITDGMIPVL